MTTTFEPLTQEEKQRHNSSSTYIAPSLYVSTFGKYNRGNLAGQWIDLTTFCDYEEFCDYCRRLHWDEEDPEFMVQDYEYYPSSLYHEAGLPTEEEFDRILEYADLDDNDQEAYALYLANYNEKADVDEFREYYMGHFRSGEDFTEYICEECGYFTSLPDWLQCCIDYSAVWRSLDTGGNYSEYNGHIFTR